MSEPGGALAELAARLVNARRTGAKLGADAGDALCDFDDCYAVQRAVAVAIGAVGGFKTARKPGQPQIMAPIFAKDVRRSPASFGREIDRIGIELEVGFLVTEALPDADVADFAKRARGCVAAVPALEIVDTRLADPDAVGPLLRLADNQINGALVVGEPVAEWQHLDLATVTARLELGDETVLDSAAEVPGGDAFETFCRFARMVGRHCDGLRPGQVVITGSLNGLPYVERGTSARGHIDGLGAVAADFPG